MAEGFELFSPRIPLPTTTHSLQEGHFELVVRLHAFEGSAHNTVSLVPLHLLNHCQAHDEGMESAISS